MGLENSSDIIFSREWRISYTMYSSVRVLNTFFVFKSEIPATRSGRINERPILLFSNKVQLNIYISQTTTYETADQSVMGFANTQN